MGVNVCKSLKTAVMGKYVVLSLVLTILTMDYCWIVVRFHLKFYKCSSLKGIFDVSKIICCYSVPVSQNLNSTYAKNDLPRILIHLNFDATL